MYAGRATATTHDMKGAEDYLVGFARGGRGRCRPFGDANRPCRRDWLNDEQKAAVAHVLTSRDRVMILRGAAGSGKTTLEQEIGEALHEAAVPVQAIAQSTGAVEELRDKAGFAGAATVARFLQDKAMQQAARGGLILLDEASLVGTMDMRRLFTIAAEQQARVLLVGDKRQHRSVSAGEPLKLLESHAGLPVAEVTHVLRQTHADYRQAAKALSEGKTAEGFAELDRLGWIVEVPDDRRYQVMADAYLAAVHEKNADGSAKTALCVSPTHAECARVTDTVRAALAAEGKLGEQQTLAVWVPSHLTDPQKADATHYEAGDLLQFHKHAPGIRQRLATGGRPKASTLPLAHADRFELYRPSQITLAVGDRLRITANGTSKDGKHALRNGALFTVQGFTKRGDPVVDHGWVIDRDWGHVALGYAVTSMASEGKTVNKVFIAESSLSVGATNQRSFYVPVTRGKEQALIYTDSKHELLRAVQRPDTPLSATEFVQSSVRSVPLRQRLKNHLAFVRRAATFARTHAPRPGETNRHLSPKQEHNHAR